MFIPFNKRAIIIFLVSAFTLLVGFFFNEDVSGGGTSGDFYSTFGYVTELKANIFAISEVTIHLPLHYLILSKINYFANDMVLLRFAFLIISISVPILFYLCLKNRFATLSKDNALIIASLIFLFPSFRYSAIWANSHITALIFFLLSIYFFLRVKNFFFFNLNIYLSLFFLSLAAYSRQYYALFFLFYLYFYYNNLKFLYFLIISFYIVLLSLPGWLLIYYNPAFLFGSGGAPIFSLKLYNSLLVSSSIIFVYLVPVIFTILLMKKSFFYKNFFLLTVVIFLSIFIVFISSIFFDYNFKLGGGVFLKASRYFFSNNLLFYFTSVIGFIIIFYLASEHKDNFIILTILLLGFSGTAVLQKYYEPMFFIIFYLFIRTKLHKNLLNLKSTIFSYLYYFFYYIASLINSFYKFSLSI
jgi:hypothetical protein